MIRTCLGKGGEMPLWFYNHQMNIERLARAASKRFNNNRAKRYVRYEPSIHYVDMNPVGAGIVDRPNLFGKPREICRQDRRRDEDCFSGRVVAAIQFIQS